MITVLIGTMMSFFVCFLLLKFSKLHARFSSDLTDAGPQKFHSLPTPRIGGVAIAVGLIAAYTYIRSDNLDSGIVIELSYLVLAALPAFAGGVLEDLTKRVSVSKRLVLSIVSAGIGVWLLGAVVTHLGIAPLDWLLKWPVIAILLTLFAVGGVVNAINIIDGFNGIVSGFAGFMLMAIAYVSFQLDDIFLLNASLAMLGALLGFLVWNYPHGKIFLGDGGSYLIGFWLAELAVLIVARHPEVSPWFAALLLVHPVCETLFSVYRRKFLHGQSPWHPDGLHLHTLIFRRLNHRQWASKSAHHKAHCNSMTAPYFWTLKAITALLAVIFWDNSAALIVSTLLFVYFYVWLYWRIVKFNTPIWMVKRDRRRFRSAASDCALAGGEEKRERRHAKRLDLGRVRSSIWFVRRNRRKDGFGRGKVFRPAKHTKAKVHRTTH